jgi:putative flippase GtrA
MEILVKQTYRFIVTGVSASLVNYMIFAFSYLILNINYIYASIIGFLLVSFLVYHVRKLWVFADTFKKKRYQFFSFMVLEVISLSTGITVLFLLTEFALINPLISQIFTIMTTATINFLGNKYIIF